eukprot:CAMPEP_0119014274 /NCGR_PEP_ID=MMETSP1176-20130426/9450_1 /TAXON_ID=265551 /ORGANISM="Synedropsis recta cf, Strain CCMP1620" /LENGTH=334 /DNA_ID=CAMNT_0006967429 /DNA_START=56 /DNA_END=1060 /DNA_ORIENTATION=+
MSIMPWARRAALALFCIILLGTQLSQLKTIQSREYLQEQSHTTSNAATPATAAFQAHYGEKKYKPIDLPVKTTSVIINIGSNVDPILPKQSDGPCSMAIAFEPLVYSKIDQSHQQLLVVPAAVSSESGLTSMFDYGENSVSASLSRVSRNSYWNTGGGARLIAPVVSLVDVIQSIRKRYPIKHIMTDIQGHDFETIRSAIHLIRERNVTTLRTEVSLEQARSYVDSENDLCAHWLPFMSANGYTLESLDPPREGFGSHDEAVESCSYQIKRLQKERKNKFSDKMKEADALWRLAGVTKPLGLTFYRYPIWYPDPPRRNESILPRFTNEEYAQCN